MIGLGALVGVGLATAGWVRAEDSLLRAGITLAGVSIAMRYLAGGLGFVPGAFAVLPVVAAAPLLARRSGNRLIVGAVGGVVLVLLLQWTGSLAAQWGGRYLLLPASVVAVVALAEIERRDVRHPASVLAIVSTAAIALLGLGWHVERTNEVAMSRDEILAVTDGEVVISTHSHFPREVAVDLVDQRWLLGRTPELVADAFSVAAEAAPGERVWLLHPGTRCVDDPCARTWAERVDSTPLAGWRSSGVHEVRWLVGGTYVLEGFEPV